MNKEELVELLEDIAIKDLRDGHDINDHPCRIAIMAINKCYDDILYLRQLKSGMVVKKSKLSKKARFLLEMNYNPTY